MPLHVYCSRIEHTNGIVAALSARSWVATSPIATRLTLATSRPSTADVGSARPDIRRSRRSSIKSAEPAAYPGAPANPPYSAVLIARQTLPRALAIASGRPVVETRRAYHAPGR